MGNRYFVNLVPLGLVLLPRGRGPWVALGAVLVTGIGFVLASLGRDMMSVMGWGILAILILSVPAFGVMFPGTVSSWARFIPSYYLLDTIYQASSLGAGWVDLWPNLLMLLGFDVTFVTLGIVALRRRFQ